MPNRMLVLNVVWIVTITVFSAFGIHADQLPQLTHKLTVINEIRVAPPLNLLNMDEETVDIIDLQGKIVIVNFWATWCPPCRREMGSLERLYQATKDKGVEVLAVNIGEDVDTVFSFLGMVEPAPSFEMVFDPVAVSMKHWQVRGLPTTYVINPDGNIAYRAIGGRQFDHPLIQKQILQLSR